MDPFYNQPAATPPAQPAAQPEPSKQKSADAILSLYNAPQMARPGPMGMMGGPYGVGMVAGGPQSMMGPGPGPGVMTMPPGYPQQQPYGLPPAGYPGMPAGYPGQPLGGGYGGVPTMGGMSQPPVQFGGPPNGPAYNIPPRPPQGLGMGNSFGPQGGPPGPGYPYIAQQNVPGPGMYGPGPGAPPMGGGYPPAMAYGGQR